MTSIEPIRRRIFNVFFYSHAAFVAFYVFIFMHSAAARPYVWAAIGVYGADRLLRVLKVSGLTRLLPSNMTILMTII